MRAIERTPAALDGGLRLRIRRRGSPRTFGVHQVPCSRLGIRNSGAAEDHDGRLDPLVLQLQLGLEQLELQAQRPRLVAHQKIDIRVGETVGR